MSREAEQLVYARLIADTEAVNGIVSLLGDASHIVHGFQDSIPVVPYLTFSVYSTTKGQLGGNFSRSLEVFMQFDVYASNYSDVVARIRHLFDGYRFDVPANYTDIGQLRGLFDFEGPDGYDETLEVQSKQVRYRLFITPKAWNPITA
jgi:hypothetical protein